MSLFLLLYFTVFFNPCFREERLCQEPVPPQPSNLTSIPEHVPIDWFSPTYWNYELTVHDRIKYIGDGPVSVALPLEEHCGTWADCKQWKNLSEEEFMASYGNAVLALYDMPTDEER